MVIFGASGDLTHRLLFPALYNLCRTGLIPQPLAIVGVDIVGQSVDDWRQSLRKMLESFVNNPNSENSIDAVDEGVWQRLTTRMTYVQGDFSDRGLFEKLRLHLHDVARDCQTAGNCLFYLAVADRFFGPLVEQLGHAGLLDEELRDGVPQRWRRVVIEKPFGHSIDSARELNTRIRRDLREEQIFRIDHFLGKETVQNILVLRFANGIFEPLWDRDHIDHVQITAAETVGVETRGRFYERTGALRDMVPNHLFQLLAMIGMEPPNSFNADAVRAKKTELLQAIHPISPENAVRGQYGSGTVLGRPVPGYRQEPNVAPDSGTETYVALKLGIDNWRWAGVPFYLRTGKHLTARTTEIAVQFRRAPYALFRETPVERLPPNILTLRIQPDEGLSVSFNAKRPGSEIEIDGVAMDFSYREYFGPLAAVGYETLIYDCLIGDAILFQRADTVEAAWCAVQRVIDYWAREPAKEFPNYAAGSAGPDAAAQLLARDGRAWSPIRAEHPHKALRP